VFVFHSRHPLGGLPTLLPETKTQRPAGYPSQKNNALNDSNQETLPEQRIRELIP
jgi:hypothetical protein